MDYKYSIVVPAYNVEKYISEMVESIINQTYSNWELIIIDDGSKDKTGEICEQYVNDKVFVYHIENKGQIGARIEGIQKCSGDYTLVVDADDFLETNCLQEVNNVLNQKEYDSVIFPYDCCNEKLEYIYTTVAPDHIGELSQWEVLKWIIDLMNHGLVNKAVKTKLIKQGVSEAMVEKVSINGDLALIVPIMCYVKTAYYINVPLYKYRILPESTSHNRIYKNVIDTDHVTEAVVDVLKRHHLFNGEVECSIMRSYFMMIVWLLSEVNHSRFIAKEEIDQLHRSQFFQKSRRYETKPIASWIKIIELKVIRNEGKGALLWMNIFLRLDTFSRRLLHNIAEIAKKLSPKK